MSLQCSCCRANSVHLALLGLALVSRPVAGCGVVLLVAPGPNCIASLHGWVCGGVPERPSASRSRLVTTPRGDPTAITTYHAEGGLHDAEGHRQPLEST